MKNVYLLLSFGLLLLCGGMVSSTLAYASNDFTANNVQWSYNNTFSFDYTGNNISGATYVGLWDNPANGNWYFYALSATCTSSHCSGTGNWTWVNDPGGSGNYTVRTDGATCSGGSGDGACYSQTLSGNPGTVATPTPTGTPPTPTPAVIGVNGSSQNAITGLLSSIVTALTGMIPVALPIVAVFVVSISAIFFLWKVARHFLGH